MAIAWRQKSWALPPTPLLSPLVDFSCHLESVCCMAFQQYDNLYGFGRGLQRLFGSATSSFTFRCIQWVSSPLPLPLCLSFCPLFSLTLYSFPFFPAYRSGSAPPSYSHHADRSAGHQRGFISHSETASSLMDGSAILFNSPPLRSPTPPSSPSLHLPPCLLARARSLLSLRRRLFSRPFFFLRVYPTTRCEIIYCGWILEKFTSFSMRCVGHVLRRPRTPRVFRISPSLISTDHLSSSSSFLRKIQEARGYGRYRPSI